MAEKHEIEELEAQVIERVLFWDGAINLLIRLRDDGGRNTARVDHSIVPSRREFSESIQKAINAALVIQQQELSQCLMIAGVGGERAMEYARERAKKVLGDKLEYAVQMGYVPTFWHDRGDRE